MNRSRQQNGKQEKPQPAQKVWAAARRRFQEDWDRLPVADLEEANRIVQLGESLQTGGSQGEDSSLQAQADALNSILNRRTNRSSRSSFVELVWIVFVIALGVRTFWFHPMVVPTGSMMPAFGGESVEVVSEGFGESANAVGLGIVHGWVFGVREIHSIAREEGTLKPLDRVPARWFGLVPRQRFLIGSTVHSVWLPSGNLWPHLERYEGRTFKKGETVLRLRHRRGDRMMVNRFIYNFRRPHRSEPIVLLASAIEDDPEATYYLKRIVGLAEEEVSIDDSGQLHIGGRHQRLAIDPSDPIYLNGKRASEMGLLELSPRLESAQSTLTVRPHHLFVLGDHSANSRDSRIWGDIPREAVMGRPSFVFWPISERFGWCRP